MTEIINITKEPEAQTQPYNKWLDVGVTSLIAWIIGHLVAIIVLTIIEKYHFNNFIYNVIYVTVVIGIAMLVVDNKIPDKIIAMMAKKKAVVVKEVK